MPGLFALFKGDSGAGKTVGALSFPNPVVVDFDRKMPAICNKHFPGKNVPYKQYENVLDAGETMEEWLKGGCPFDTLIVDSLTSLSYSCLKTVDDLKGSSIMDKLRQTKKGKAVETRSFDHYNAEDNFLKFYIDGAKMLWQRPGRPHHVILIAHVMTSEAEKPGGDIVKMRRIVTAGNKIAAYIPAQFDEAWHFSVAHGDLLSDKPGAVRVKHIVTTESLGDDFAKTAYTLPAKIDFTNASLFEKISSSLESNYGAPPSSQSTQPESNQLTKPANKITF